MKTFERQVLSYIKASMSTYMDPLQFANQPYVGVNDALIYMLQRAYAHLNTPDASVRFRFFDFSSAFNTGQPQLFCEKMRRMQVDSSLVLWCMDYLSCKLQKLQYLRLQNSVSNTILSSTGVPQGTVLAPFLFTIYTADFQYNTYSFFLQKFSDDSVIVGLFKGDEEEECRRMIKDFVDWSNHNHLHFNILKTKETVVDFRRKRTQSIMITIRGIKVDCLKPQIPWCAA